MVEDDAVARPRFEFLKRKGHDLTLTDDAGQRHRATITPVTDEGAGVATREEGSFTFGYCKSCNWVGPARRARGKAARDADDHLTACPGNAKVRIGTTTE